MNHSCLENTEIVSVLSREKLWDRYFVEARCTSYGKDFTDTFMRATPEEAAQIKPGHRLKRN